MTRILLLAAFGCAATAGALIAAQGDAPPPDRGAFGVRPIARALDTNRDGTISATELAGAGTSLLALDRNRDGRLGADEFRPTGRSGGNGRRGREGGGQREGATAANDDDLADTLMSFDRDGNETLQRTEVPDRFQGLFDRADADKDGALTRDELKQSAAANRPSGPGRGEGEGRGRGHAGGGRGPVDPLLAALDTNGDRTLTADEIAAAPKALGTVDRNRDGSLTPDEFTPAFGRRGSQGVDDAGGRR